MNLSKEQAAANSLRQEISKAYTDNGDRESMWASFTKQQKSAKAYELKKAEEERREFVEAQKRIIKAAKPSLTPRSR